MSKNIMQMCADEIAGHLKRIAELEAKLAEKEKEIETIQENSDKNIDYLIEFASLIEDQKDCNRMLKALERVRTGKKYIVDKEHQDKISFAVDKLVGVQKYIDDKAIYIEELDFGREIKDFIDNQIKELRSEK